MKKEIQKIIKEEKYIELMKSNQGRGDTEAQHGNADDILIDFLKKIGAENLAEEWRKVDKWYA